MSFTLSPAWAVAHFESPSPLGEETGKVSQRNGILASSSRGKEPGWIQLGVTEVARGEIECWRLGRSVCQVIVVFDMRKYGKVTFEGSLKLAPEFMTRYGLWKD